MLKTFEKQKEKKREYKAKMNKIAVLLCVHSESEKYTQKLKLRKIELDEFQLS